MVRIDCGISDCASFIYYKASRHWQLPGAVAVEFFQVNAEALVNFAQIFRQLPRQVELMSNFIIFIKKKIEANVLFLNYLLKKLRFLRRYGNQGSATVADIFNCVLQN